MTAIDTEVTPSPTISPATRRKRRAFGVLGAVAAAVAVWAIARISGANLVVDLRNGQPPMAVGIGIVIMFAGQAVLLGWLALAVLERFTAKARTLWTALALAVLAVSFLPIVMATANGGTKAALAAMHVAVAAVLIPGLRRR